MNVSRTANVLALSLAWLTFLTGCSCKQEGGVATPRKVQESVSSLVTEIRALKGSEHWNTFADLQWNAYLAAAKRMLSLTESELYNVFSDCNTEEDQDKLFLLNRLLFEANGNHPEFFGWYQVPRAFPGEIYEWPIQWRNNRPEFFSTGLAIDGRPYNGLADYLQRKECLPLRKL
jgi:hypothetical protein